MFQSTCKDRESSCPKSTDGIHCSCWYDAKSCCYCDDPAVVHVFVALKNGGYICLDCRELDE